MNMIMTVWAVTGIGEIRNGDDLSTLVGDRFDSEHPEFAGQALAQGDILAVNSKIISKAEGRTRAATDREDAITAETVRVVATRVHPAGITRIVENSLGLVMAAAGVDASNTPLGTVLLLPVDPDASARKIASTLRKRFGIQVGVLITDTVGRPWREGQTDIAIGAAGIRVLDDLRGSFDAGGRVLEVSVSAIADEIASAAELVKGKSRGLPVAVVRGLESFVHELSEPGAASLVRAAGDDMFRLGSAEAYSEGLVAGREEVENLHHEWPIVEWLRSKIVSKI